MVTPDELASMFRASEPQLAERIQDSRTTVDEIALPFLKPSQHFVEVVTRTGRYPTKFPVLYEGNRAVFLADQPDELKRLAREWGFKLDNAPAAVAYVATLLRLGQPYSRRLVILDRFTDVPLVSSAGPDERTHYEALTAKYANRITSPRVEMKNGGAQGSGYMVRAQALEQFTFRVEPNGQAEINRVELEPDLPINLQT